MNWASARCRRATPPRITVNRAPESLAPAAASSPSGSPTSRWSFTAKSKVAGVPQRRTSTLSASLRPTGTDSCGRLGRLASSASSDACTDSSSAGMPACSCVTALTSASSALASSPLPLAWPICLDSALRCACSASARVCSALRRASRAS